MSAIAKLVKKIEAMETRARQVASKEIIVGWENDAKEQPRAMSKSAALAINAKNVGKNGRRKKKPEFVSNFDVNFVGPGRQTASLARIALTLCFGREGAKSSKDGHEYGRIPARNFLEVLKNKHSKPIFRSIADQVIKKGADGNVDVGFIGGVAAGQLQRAMKDSNEYAPNSEFTRNGGWMTNPVNGKPFHAEPKKGERPLIDSQTLINKVAFEIKDRGV